MPRWIIAAALCLSAGTAHAGSVEPFQPTASTRTSIIEVGCPPCVLEAERKAAEEAMVRLGPGEQIFEVREMDGEPMIYRTEQWLGGSPVTMVRKASEADLIALGLAAPKDGQTAAIKDTDAGVTPVTVDAAQANAGRPVTEPALTAPPLFEPVTANSSPGVDAEATTSALGGEPADPFDPSKFELRLN